LNRGEGPGRATGGKRFSLYVSRGAVTDGGRRWEKAVLGGGKGGGGEDRGIVKV